MMITHVSAYNGGLRMYAGNYRNLKGWSKTAKGVAYTLKTCGIGDAIMGDSSMDFASEDGFKTDDGAMLLLKRALELV
tara:strand:- start:599 stop:832 length:234 start_codon:yes stop_codon:yes gene_type:complete